jgi:ATP-dependent Lon protease
LFSNELLEHIIDTYTYESGVRKLKEKIIEIIRDVNYNIALGQNNQNLINNINFNIFPIIISKRFVDNLFCEKLKVEYKKISETPQVGLVNGLYATVTGLGGITIIEISKMLNDTKLALELTGQQGDVMKESMKCAKTVAWNLIPDENKKKLKEEWSDLGNWGLHIHCPDGATPKDGPSAGCAITIGIISRLCNIKVNNKIALTGEIDLNGNVKKIGGLKAKIEGAKRAGVELVLVPTENEQELRNYLSDFYYQKHFKKLENLTFNIKIEKLIKIINPLVQIKLVSHIEEICKLIFVDTDIFDNLSH